jgi:hypothetical protein
MLRKGASLQKGKDKDKEKEHKPFIRVYPE